MAVADKFLAFAMWVVSFDVLSAAQFQADVEYAKPGGVPLTLDVSVPEGVGPYPAIIVVHGGGFTKGDKQTFVPPLFPPLTGARFTWFSINYRLAPQDPFPAGADDVVSAIEWVQAHAAEYKADKKRIALVGESAGAFLVDYAAVKLPKSSRIAAVVSFYGPHDLLFQVQARNGVVGEGLTAFTGVHEFNEEGQARLREISPYYLLHRHLPPFLLIHGTEDEQVPYEQSIRFRRALLDHGGRCELFTVEGGRHGVGSWEKSPELQAYKAKMVEWLRETLR